LQAPDYLKRNNQSLKEVISKEMFHKKDYTNLKLKLSIANCGVRTEFVTPPSFFEKEIRRRKRNLRYKEILVVLF